MATLYRSIESDKYIGLYPGPDYTEEDDKKLKFMYEYYNAVYYNGKLGSVLVTLLF